MEANNRSPILACGIRGRRSREACTPCREPQDVYSWHSGWVEGTAKRQGHEYSLDALTPADIDEYKASKLNRPHLPKLKT